MDIATIKSRVQEMSEQLIQIRRALHMYPEKGYEEYKTAEKIIEFLKQQNIPFQSGLLGTGVIAHIQGKEAAPVIGVRVDMDALQMQDKTTSYTSVNHGIAHACGHDVHVAIGLGLCKLLSEIKDQLPGSIKVLFQPGEETPRATSQAGDPFTEAPTAPGGAILLIEEEKLLEHNRFDAMIGIHCWPSLRVGKVGYQHGGTMAGTGNFHIAVIGKGGHAATPHKTVDPIPVAAQIISALQTIVSRKIDPGHPVVLTIGAIKGGTRRSIISEKVDMTGTVRSFDLELLEKTIPDAMRDLVGFIAKVNGADCQLNYGVNLPPVINDEVILQIAIESLHNSFGDNAVLLNEAAMTGDDFAHFSKRIPSVYLKLGTSNEEQKTNYPLHSPSFDVDESCIGYGILAISQIVIDLLTKNQEENQ